MPVITIPATEYTGDSSILPKEGTSCIVQTLTGSIKCGLLRLYGNGVPVLEYHRYKYFVKPGELLHWF